MLQSLENMHFFSIQLSWGIRRVLKRCSFNREEDASLQDESIKAKLLSRILFAESEIEEGKFADADESIARIFHHRQDYFWLVWADRIPNVSRMCQSGYRLWIVKMKQARKLPPGLLVFMAPRVGLEPTTLRLTAECSAIELPRNVRLISDAW